MKAKLTTLTPVHIGSGTTYNKGIDFVQLGDKIGIIDERKVLEIIGEEYVNQWVSIIEKFDPNNAKNSQPILELMESRGIKGSLLEMASSRICKLKSRNNHSSFLKEHFRTSVYETCIPGSSLKGAIKTTILDDFTKYYPIDFSVNDIKSVKNGRTIWEDKNIDRKVFGEDANTKSTRFLKIGDIQFRNLETEVHEVRVLNIEGDEWRFKRGQQFLIEAIPAKSSTIFNLSIDTRLLEENIKRNPDLWNESKVYFLTENYSGLAEKINEVTKELIQWELETLEDEEFPDEGYKMLDKYNELLASFNDLSDNEFIIRVGGNNGWLFTTAGWWRKFYDRIPENDWNLLRNTIQRRNYQDMDIWPKTRKISSEGEILGFVKVSIEH